MRHKAAELRNLSLPELDAKKSALDKELFELRQKKVTGQLDKPHFFKIARKQIAQIHTIKQGMKHDSAKSGK